MNHHGRIARFLPAAGFLGVVAITGWWAASARAAAGIPVAPGSEPGAVPLPTDVAAATQRWLPVDAKQAAALQALSPGDLEQQEMIGLANVPAAEDFVLARLGSEPPRAVASILKVIAYSSAWAEQPHAAAALRQLAIATPDPDLMLAYLDAARRLEIKQLRKVISVRIAAAKRSGDARALQTLAAADERWIMLERGAMFPGFMRRVPPVFSVKPADQPIRAIGFGDFGEGSAGQREVAATIVRVNAAARPFDFGITFGDNFYPSGMTSPTESRWVDWWEKLYGPLRITFYPSLGNHEWYSDDGAVAEILHRSPTWLFPAPYYAFTAGPVEFFAVDTTDLSAAQLAWLDGAIAASRSPWKVVYGHHPIFAPEAQSLISSSSLDYLARTQTALWPLLRGRVDAYLCGHQHAMAHMAPREGVRFFMSGGGGASLSAVDRHAPGARFAASEFGFLTLEADAHRMSLAIFGAEGAPLDSEAWTK